jgi:hypothetical protein
VPFGSPSEPKVASGLKERRDERSQTQEDDQGEEFIELPRFVSSREINDGVADVEVC